MPGGRPDLCEIIAFCTKWNHSIVYEASPRLIRDKTSSLKCVDNQGQEKGPSGGHFVDEASYESTTVAYVAMASWAGSGHS